MRTSFRTRIGLPAVLAAACALAVPFSSGAPAAAATTPWSQDGYGAANTGHNPAETVLTAGTVAALRAQWSVRSPADLSCSRQTPPLVGGDRIFLPDSTGVAAYDAGTGRELWRHAFADPTDTHSPLLALVGTRLIAGWSDCASQSDPDGHLLALDTATGAQRWTVSSDTPVQAMVADKGFVAFSGQDAGHTATETYRVADGHSVWNRTSFVMDTGVSAGGRLLLARTGQAGVESVEIATGAVRWRRAETLSAVAADAAGTRFFATEAGGRLWSVSATSGRTAWSVPAAAGPVATDGRRIYLAHGDDIRALSATTGAPVWSKTLTGTAGRPILAGGVLYVAAVGLWLTSMNPDTGGYAGFRATFGAVGHAVVADGHLYVTDGTTLRMYAR